jgi:hypothetical protein
MILGHILRHEIMINRVKRASIILVLVFCFVATKVQADLADNWCAEYIGREQHGLHKIFIRRDKVEIKIHAYAFGFPDDIDLGEAVAEVYPGSGLVQFVAHFSDSKSKSMLVISPNSGGSTDHPGGLISANLFVNHNDGRRECISSLFDTPRAK